MRSLRKSSRKLIRSKNSKKYKKIRGRVSKKKVSKKKVKRRISRRRKYKRTLRSKGGGKYEELRKQAIDMMMQGDREGAKKMAQQLMKMRQESTQPKITYHKSYDKSKSDDKSHTNINEVIY